jgi:hypothetical protein
MLDKRVGFIKLHEDVMIVAAGNDPEVSSIARRLPLPLMDRTLALKVQTPSVEAWREWMDKQYKDAWDKRVYAFLRSMMRPRERHPKEFLMPPKDVMETLDNYPTPRSWTKVAVMLPRIEPEHALLMIRGYLGDEVGGMFVKFLRVQPPPLEEIVKNPSKWHDLELDVKWMLLVKLSDAIKDVAKERNLKLLEKYLELSEEIRKDKVGGKDLQAGLATMVGEDSMIEALQTLTKKYTMERALEIMDKALKGYEKIIRLAEQLKKGD